MLEMIRPAQSLIDTGCTTKSLPTKVFGRRLQQKEVAWKKVNHTAYGHCTELPIYVLRLPLHIQDPKTEEVFVVSHINDNSTFPGTHDGPIKFNKAIMQEYGSTLKCTHR